MPDDSPTGQLLTLLSRLRGGEVAVDWNHRPWIHLDGDARNVEVDLDPFTASGGRLRAMLHFGRVAGWKSVGLPKELAQLGWRVSLRSEERPVLELGRGTSAVTGHVHVELRALPHLARLF